MELIENKEWLKNYDLVLDFIDEQCESKPQYEDISDKYYDLLWYEKKDQLKILDQMVKVITKENWGNALIKAINKMKTML